jgi:anaerobic selenocysteine-containing dehydrogenase
MTTDGGLPVLTRAAGRLLTADAFQCLADVPPELEWFANLGSKATRRAYENALQDFRRFTGINQPEEFRTVTRAHVIAWREDLVQRALSGQTIRHRLAALSSLFEYLCDRNAVTHNPVKGVKRPPVESYEGKTPALGDHQARQLLDAPDAGTLKGLYVMGENPAMSDPDANHAREALAALVLLVVQDIFMTETACLADVVLPASAFAEKTGSFTNTDRTVQLARAALAPPGQARQDIAIIIDMVKTYKA